MVRLHPPLLTNLDDWAKHQSDKPSRPEAIRRILEHTLATKRGVESLAKKAAANAASELAAREIERVSDKSVPREERESRKRKLIHGPKEFREIRSDKPKTKGRQDK